MKGNYKMGKNVLFWPKKGSEKWIKYWSFQKKWDKNEVFWREGLKKNSKNWGKTTFLKGNMKKCAILQKNASKDEVFGEKQD